MTTLVCPVCQVRWKIVPVGEGDRVERCVLCIQRHGPAAVVVVPVEKKES